MDVDLERSPGSHTLGIPGRCYSILHCCCRDVSPRLKTVARALQLTNEPRFDTAYPPPPLTANNKLRALKIVQIGKLRARCFPCVKRGASRVRETCQPFCPFPKLSGAGSLENMFSTSRAPTITCTENTLCNKGRESYHTCTHIVEH